MTALVPLLEYFGDTKEDPFKVLDAPVIEVQETQREPEGRIEILSGTPNQGLGAFFWQAQPLRYMRHARVYANTVRVN